MGKPSFSLRTNLISLCAAALLTCGLLPSIALAATDDSVAVGSALTASQGSGEAAKPNSDLIAGNEGSVLASALTGSTSSVLSVDVDLDAAEPVIGSFMVDGLAYAVNPDGLALVSVDPAAVFDGNTAISESVTYNGMTYPVTAVAPYAFYLSGATQVELAASITSVDDRAFRSSDVERVDVAAGNSDFASFDGCLYDSQLLRLLLIPEGRAGAVLLPSETEVAEPSVFSHCSLVEAIDVEEGGAAFASWDGLLYTADGTTLLRVPAGATEITIRDGCTTVAAGAMEGCAKLERINAPASVTSISPDVFTSIPTVSLPAMAVSQDESDDTSGAEGEAEVPPRRAVAESQGLSAPLALPDLGSTSALPSSEASGTNEAETQPSSHEDTDSSVASGLPDQSNTFTNFAPQLTAMVALASIDDDSPEVDAHAITVFLLEGMPRSMWGQVGFSVRILEDKVPMASMETAASYNACTDITFSVPASLADKNLYITAYGYFRKASEPAPDGRPPEDKSGTKPVALTTAGKKFTNYTTQAWNNNGMWFDPARCGLRQRLVAVGDTQSLYYAVFAVSIGPDGPWRQITKFQVGGTVYSSGALISSGVWDPIVVLDWDKDIETKWEANGGAFDGNSSATFGIRQTELPAVVSGPRSEEGATYLPTRLGYRFVGWASSPNANYKDAETEVEVTEDGGTWYAIWLPEKYDISFDTSSEPDDENYPGEAKPDETMSVESGQIAIEDPKRPGYVFEGWVIPNADGTEAVDQELVYEGEDGKWYVDASKLPDYAGDDGRVELTARWTSVISVDVPSSVTFYADTVTQGQESREGRAEGAFGQNKVANQGQVDLRVVGLESSAVKTTGSTLGADSILKKAEAATPSSSAAKLLSLYPSEKAWTAEELQSPDAVSGAKVATAVDFDLDDILLEKSFPTDSFSIPAGDTLNMGYRLNLTETGQQLDYDKLSTLEDGQSAAIANVSYCFAADGHVVHGSATGSRDDDIYIEYNGKVYGTNDIIGAANCISELGEASPCYALYDAIMRAQGVPSDGYLPADAGAKVYAKYTGPEATANQPNCNRAGYVRLLLLGVNHDVLELKAGYPDANGFAGDGSKDPVNGEPYVAKRAGLTFQFMDALFSGQMNTTDTNVGGWRDSLLRNVTFSGSADIQRNLMVADSTKAIYKFTNNVSGGRYTPWSEVISVTRDKLFAVTHMEAVGFYAGDSDHATSLGEYAWVNHEGFQYGYWDEVCDISHCPPESPATSLINAVRLAKREASNAPVTWWNRGPVNMNQTHSRAIEKVSGSTGAFMPSSQILNVAPAFCL